VDADRTLIASSLAGDGLACLDGGTATLLCCDIFGNEGGDWEADCLEGQLGSEGNIWQDPRFCDAVHDDFTVHYESPCDWNVHPECPAIGAYSVGCGVPLQEREMLEMEDTAIVDLRTYPNPCDYGTIVHYSIRASNENASLRLAVYDLCGRMVRILVEESSLLAGDYTVPWNGKDNAGSDVAAGAYFLKLHGSDVIQEQRVLVLR